MPFAVGDRVTRQIAVTGTDRKLGTITKQYTTTVSLTGTVYTLYEVQWDGGHIERGFMEHGLQKEESK